MVEIAGLVDGFIVGGEPTDLCAGVSGGRAEGEKLPPSRVGEERAIPGCGDGVEAWGGRRSGGPMSETGVVLPVVDFLTGDFLPSLS